MRKEFCKRLLALAPLLLLVSFLAFFLLHWAAGDVVDFLYQDASVSADVFAEKRRALRLDQPLLFQYFHWIGGIMTGDLGASYVSGGSVSALLVPRLLASLALMATSLCLALLLAVPLGVSAATYKGSRLDTIIMTMTYPLLSMPSFFLGILLLYLFSVELRLLPSIGDTSPAGLILPCLTLALVMAAKYTRQVRAAVLAAYQLPHIKGARARGISGRRILYRHVLPHTLFHLVPLCTLSIGSLIGGSAVVEVLFRYDGAGLFAVTAIEMRDVPAVLAYVLVMAAIYTLTHAMGELWLDRLDPRRVLARDEGGLFL